MPISTDATHTDRDQALKIAALEYAADADAGAPDAAAKLRAVYAAVVGAPNGAAPSRGDRAFGEAIRGQYLSDTDAPGAVEALEAAAHIWDPNGAPPVAVPVKRLEAEMPAPLIRYAGRPPADRRDDFLLHAGSVLAVAGAGGVGKSRLALQLALTAAGGGEGWGDSGLGLEVCTGSAVLYASYEDHPAIVRRRCDAMARETRGLIQAGFDSDRMHFLDLNGWPLFGPAADAYGAGAAPLNGWPILWNAAEALGARLIIIDPVTAGFTGDGNAVAPVRQFVGALAGRARDIGAGVVFVCHGTKASRARDASADDPGRVAGSAAWVDAARAAITLQETFDKDGKATGPALFVAKANYAAAGQPIPLFDVRLSNGAPVAFAARDNGGGAAGDAQGESYETQDGAPPLY